MRSGTYCYVPGCLTGRERKKQKGLKNYSLFRAPSDPKLLRRWEIAIGRMDKELSSCNSVCERHFLKKEIERHYLKKLPDGSIDRIKKKKATLIPGAVPSIFPNYQPILSIDETEMKSPVIHTLSKEKARNIVTSSKDKELPVVPALQVNDLKVLRDKFYTTIVIKYTPLKQKEASVNNKVQFKERNNFKVLNEMDNNCNGDMNVEWKSKNNFSSTNNSCSDDNVKKKKMSLDNTCENSISGNTMEGEKNMSNNTFNNSISDNVEKDKDICDNMCDSPLSDVIVEKEKIELENTCDSSTSVDIVEEDKNMSNTFDSSIFDNIEEEDKNTSDNILDKPLSGVIMEEGKNMLNDPFDNALSECSVEEKNRNMSDNTCDSFKSNFVVEQDKNMLNETSDISLSPEIVEVDKNLSNTFDNYISDSTEKEDKNRFDNILDKPVFNVIMDEDKNILNNTFDNGLSDCSVEKKDKNMSDNTWNSFKSSFVVGQDKNILNETSDISLSPDIVEVDTNMSNTSDNSISDNIVEENKHMSDNILDNHVSNVIIEEEKNVLNNTFDNTLSDGNVEVKNKNMSDTCDSFQSSFVIEQDKNISNKTLDISLSHDIMDVDRNMFDKSCKNSLPDIVEEGKNIFDKACDNSLSFHCDIDKNIKDNFCYNSPADKIMEENQKILCNSFDIQADYSSLNDKRAKDNTDVSLDLLKPAETNYRKLLYEEIQDNNLASKQNEFQSVLDKFSSFGSHVATQLSQLPNNLAVILQNNIQELIIKARLKAIESSSWAQNLKVVCQNLSGHLFSNEVEKPSRNTNVSLDLVKSKQTNYRKLSYDGIQNKNRSSVQNKFPSVPNEFSSFCLHVATQLSQLPNNQAVILQNNIQKLIIEARLKAIESSNWARGLKAVCQNLTGHLFSNEMEEPSSEVKR